MKVGESERFDYNGGIQTYTVESDGLYQLDVYGAKGGNANGYAGGKGGHSKGYVYLTKGTTLYVVCGGKGTDATAKTRQWSGGYNGGGTGWDSHYGYYTGGGGGATHIALVTGLLSTIGFAKFVTNKKGLIVAGGGGGRIANDNASQSAKALAGDGGGLVGGNGTNVDGNSSMAIGGTQTSGYAFGRGGSIVGDYSYGACSGCGSGFYGGTYWNAYCSGSGGSSWIGGVPTIEFKEQTYSPMTESGANNGDGYAIITYVAKTFPTIPIGDLLLEGMAIGDTEVDSVAIGDIEIS